MKGSEQCLEKGSFLKASIGGSRHGSQSEEVVIYAGDVRVIESGSRYKIEWLTKQSKFVVEIGWNRFGLQCKHVFFDKKRP